MDSLAEFFTDLQLNYGYLISPFDCGNASLHRLQRHWMLYCVASHGFFGRCDCAFDAGRCDRWISADEGLLPAGFQSDRRC